MLTTDDFEKLSPEAQEKAFDKLSPEQQKKIAQKGFEQRSTHPGKFYVNGLLIFDPDAPNGIPNPVRDRQIQREWKALRAKWRKGKK